MHEATSELRTSAKLGKESKYFFRKRAVLATGARHWQLPITSGPQQCPRDRISMSHPYILAPERGPTVSHQPVVAFLPSTASVGGSLRAIPFQVRSQASTRREATQQNLGKRVALTRVHACPCVRARVTCNQPAYNYTFTLYTILKARPPPRK